MEHQMRQNFMINDWQTFSIMQRSLERSSKHLRSRNIHWNAPLNVCDHATFIQMLLGSLDSMECGME